MDHLSGRDSLKEVVRTEYLLYCCWRSYVFFWGGAGEEDGGLFLHVFFFLKSLLLRLNRFFWGVVWLLSTSVGDEEKEHSNS